MIVNPPKSQYPNTRSNTTEGQPITGLALSSPLPAVRIPQGGWAPEWWLGSTRTAPSLHSWCPSIEGEKKRDSVTPIGHTRKKRRPLSAFINHVHWQAHMLTAEHCRLDFYLWCVTLKTFAVNKTAGINILWTSIIPLLSLTCRLFFPYAIPLP